MPAWLRAFTRPVLSRRTVPLLASTLCPVCANLHFYSFIVAYYGHFPGIRQRSGISMLRLRTAFIIRNLSPVAQSPNWQQSITLSSRRITFDTMGIAPKSFTHQHKVYCLSNRLNNINNQKRPLS